jgi:hypothetical protein
LLPDVEGAQSTFTGDLRTPDEKPPILRRLGSSLKKKSKPKVVCAPCNNGWANRLDQAVQPLLTAMIQGKAVHLNTANQKSLAAWACLKNMAVEFDDPATRATTQASRTWLYEKQEPPTRTVIWLSRASEGDWDARHYHLAMKWETSTAPATSAVEAPPLDPPPMSVQVTTFAVGRVLFYIFDCPNDFPFVPRPTGIIGAKLVQLWPFDGDVEWLRDCAALDTDDALSVGNTIFTMLVGQINGPDDAARIARSLDRT